MASNFPKLPGYVPTHDPTIVNHKKVSHVKLDKIRNDKNVEVPLYALPRPPVAQFKPEKNEQSKSFSQSVFINHGGADIQEQFEPTFVKLDKQVSIKSFRPSNIDDEWYQQHEHANKLIGSVPPHIPVSLCLIYLFII